jgi:hypothetical protein
MTIRGDSKRILFEKDRTTKTAKIPRPFFAVFAAFVVHFLLLTTHLRV